MELTDLATIRTLCEKYDFALSKGFGQNFIVNPGVPPKIVDAAGIDRSFGVLEIGPGIGPLTAELAQRAGKVVAVELDRALLPVLAETMAPYPNVEIVPGDVLKLDLKALTAEKFPGLTPMVCANLPYNVTSPILEKLVETPCFPSFTVMIQREVARRLCAPQGSAEGGSFSLFLQYHMEPELLFDVPPEKFLPAPKVTSSVIRCVRRDRPAVEVEDEAFFFKVVRGGFLLRRKTLANSLAAALPGVSKEAVQQAIAGVGLPAAVRGEQLTLEDFAKLSAALAETGK